MSTVAATDVREVDESRSDIYVAEQMWTIRWQLYLAFIALAIGGYMGIFQALERVGVDFMAFTQMESYYQGLSIHGVTLALVLTFAFANSFVSLTAIRGFNRPLASTLLAQGSFWFMAAGLGLGSVILLMNQATVLFTFYTPMEANPLFYLAAVFLVVSTWITLANLVLTYRAWRADHPNDRIPLLSYISLATYIMWGLASIGIAVEVVFFVLPWSLGWIAETDPQLNRTFLVHRPRDCLLLVTAGIHRLVLHDPQTGWRTSVQRRTHAPDVSALLSANRAAPSIHRPRDS